MRHVKPSLIAQISEEHEAITTLETRRSASPSRKADIKKPATVITDKEIEAHMDKKLEDLIPK